MRLYPIRSLTVLALAFAAIPADAEPVTIRVPYGDVDLTSEEAIPTLKSRLADAAAEACIPDRALKSTNAAADCRTSLVRQGMADVEFKRAVALAQLP